MTKSDGLPKYEVDYQQYDGAGNLVKYSMTNQDGDGYTNKGQSFRTTGGAQQLFSTRKSAFTLVPQP